MACKPDSVPRPKARRRPSIWTHRHRVPQAAYPQARASSPRTSAQPQPGCGLLGLASGGVCLATPVTRNAGALLPHRFTLTTLARGQGWRSVFCGTFPRVTSDCRWQSPCSVKSGLSSTSRRTWMPRPPGQLVRADHRTPRVGPGLAPARLCGDGDGYSHFPAVGAEWAPTVRRGAATPSRCRAT